MSCDPRKCWLNVTGGLLHRRFRDREVGGSNPLAPTIIPYHQILVATNIGGLFFVVSACGVLSED